MKSPRAATSMGVRPTGRQLCVPGLAAAALLAATGFLPGCRDEEYTGPKVTLGKGTWKVDLSMTDQQRWIGLSGRTDLPPHTGMLFIYPDSAVREYCMRDCYVPIDIAFLDADRRVVRMHTMRVEADRVGRIGYSSDQPCQYALEVPAGELAEAGVKVGDEADFSSNIPPAAKAEAEPRR